MVDRNLKLAEDTAEKLRSFAYETETTTDKRQARKLAGEENSLQLVLLETDLAEKKDGIELARQILARKRVPVVFYTDCLDGATAAEARRVSRYGYIPKTADKYVLENAVSVALELFECDCELQKTREELGEKTRVLSRVEEKYKLLFDAANDAIFLHTIEGELPGGFVEVNRRATDSLQYSRDELLDMTVLDIAPAEEHKNIPAKLSLLLERGSATFESQQLRKDGSVFPVEVSAQVIELEGEQLVLALVRDFSRQKQVEEELHTLAIKDSLTGLFDRQVLIEKLTEEMERSRRFRRPLTVLMIDLDNFKHVNDLYGHICGDDVLRCFGEFIVNELRNFDIPIRFGGEEFCIILPETDLDAAWTVGERIRKKIATRSFESETGDKFHITCSIGFSKLEGEDDCDSFLQRADTALYQAKAGGKNRLERRADLRLKVQPKNINIKQKNEDSWTEARLVDRSNWGLQLETNLQLEPGDSLMIKLEEKDIIYGEVRWRAENSGKFTRRTGIKLRKKWEDKKNGSGILLQEEKNVTQPSN